VEKLSDEPGMDFIKDSIEVWIPEDWFVNYSIGNEGKADVVLYRWPEKVPYTIHNTEIVRQRYLGVANRELSVASLYLSNSLPNELNVTEAHDIRIHNYSATEMRHEFTDEDGQVREGYSIVIKNLPKGYKYAEIVMDNIYTNSEEIFHEIIDKVEIKG
jgi:hypothetical protein